MKALILDTETNGLFDFKQPADADGQPRMCSLAAGLVDADGSEISGFYHLIKPDWELEEKHAVALDVNGLTYERLMDEGIPVVEALERYDALVDDCEVISAYGVTFDQKVVRAEQRRAGRDDRYGFRPTFCVQRAVTKPCDLPPTAAMSRAGRNYAKTPKLAEAVEALLGETHEGAHDAMVDLKATIRLYAWCAERGLVVPKEQVSTREVA